MSTLHDVALAQTSLERSGDEVWIGRNWETLAQLETLNEVDLRGQNVLSIEGLALSSLAATCEDGELVCEHLTIVQTDTLGIYDDKTVAQDYAQGRFRTRIPDERLDVIRCSDFEVTEHIPQGSFDTILMIETPHLGNRFTELGILTKIEPLLAESGRIIATGSISDDELEALERTCESIGLRIVEVSDEKDNGFYKERGIVIERQPEI